MKRIIVLILIACMVAGCAGRYDAMAKYQYGDVILPGFPSELDTETYPCAFIVQSRETKWYQLVCTKNRVYCTEGVNPVAVGWDASVNRGHGFVCYSGDNAWVVDNDLDAEMSTGTLFLMLTEDEFDFIWTNTTIESSMGTVFLEASEPIPTFDLQSWLTGYALGLSGKPLPFGGDSDG